MRRKKLFASYTALKKVVAPYTGSTLSQQRRDKLAREAYPRGEDTKAKPRKKVKKSKAKAAKGKAKKRRRRTLSEGAVSENVKRKNSKKRTRTLSESALHGGAKTSGDNGPKGKAAITKKPKKKKKKKKQKLKS